MKYLISRFATIAPLAAAIVAASGFTPALAALDEITVTARIVEENLQESPVSITAYTADVLKNARIRDIDDLANFTPNLTFEGGETGRRQTPVIRGLGVIDTRGFDNNVGVFVDGVFISGRASQNVRMLDLERVEVVRGPQSALYGRNTFAGAINYVTRRPGNEFEGRTEVTIAEDGFLEVLGSVSGPLIGDTLSGLISFDYLDDDGQFKNTGYENIGGARDKTVYGALRFTPNDRLDINLSAYFADEFLESRPLSVVDNNCGEIDADFTTPSYDAGVPAYFCGEVTASPTDTYNLSPEAYSYDGETFRTSLDIAYDINGMELKSITSYTRNKNDAKVDLDRTQTGEPFYGYVPLADFEAAGSPPFFFLPSPAFPTSGISNMNVYLGGTGIDQTYFSQELRLSSAADQRLRWVGGVFFFDQENTDRTTLGIDARPARADLGLQPSQLQFLLVSPTPFITAALPNPILPNVAFRTDSDVTNLVEADTGATQYAAFGSVEYDFTDKLTGTAELRYTYEERDLENVSDIFFGTPQSTFKEDWSFWDPRFILRYQANDDFMWYGSVSHGSRSGGLNVAVSDPSAVPYDEEENWTYETGIKTNWLDNKLQFNASVFYIDWSDAQFRQRIASSASGTGFLTATTNATGLTSYGIELDATAYLAEGVTVGAGLGYANPEYDDGTLATGGDTVLCDYLDAGSSAFPTIPLTCLPFDSDGDGANDDFAPDLSGQRPVRTSKVTASAFAQAIRPLSDNWDWLGRADVGYRSKQIQTNVGAQFVPSRTLVNTRLGLVSEQFDLIFWVENLTNEDSPESTQTFNSNLNSFQFITTAININKRRAGVTATYRF